MSEEATVALKSCPFCGGEAEIIGTSSTEIRCQNDQCIIGDPAPFNDFSHRRDAITAWNTRADQTWRPIETAPRDGTVVWVANQHSLVPAYFAGQSHKCWRNWFSGGRYENAHLGVDHFLPSQIWFEPTHWQPLPSPPKGDEG